MRAWNGVLKVLRIILVVVLVVVAAGVVFFNVARAHEKTAVIFVPGLLASGLINEETGKPVWDPFVSDWNLMDFFDPETQMDMIGDLAGPAFKENIISDFLAGNSNSIFMQIAMDEDGVPTNKSVVPADFDTCETGQKYGAFRSFQRAYDAVNERYRHTGADIRVYCYDWRIDNRINSENLEKFINEKGYDKVVLIGHSMGNVVITNYLARNEENREKTLAHLSYAGPIYGSLNALTTLENFEGLAGMIYDMLDSLPSSLSWLASGIGDMVDELFETQFTPLGMHLPTIAQLLPSPELLDAPIYEGGKSFLYIDGQPVTTKEELLEFYTTRKWSYNDDGTAVKCFVADLEEYWDSFYVDTEKGRVHASTLVPTYYFAGVGTSTAIAAYIQDDVFVGCDYDDRGDGTVPYYSATINMSDKTYTAVDGDAKSGESYVVSVPVKSHFECGCDFKNETEEETFAYLDDLLAVSIADLFKW